MKNKKTSLEAAFHFLSFRSRSEKEMTDFLTKKDFTTSQIAETLIKLKELNFINDKKFAQEFIEARSHNKPKGKKALAIELKKKGITIDDELLTINELELAHKALEKKKPKSKEQASRFLCSRGFSWNTIERTLKDWYNDSE